MRLPIPGFLIARLDALLSTLAVNDGLPSRSLHRLLEAIYPRAAARVRMRQGNIEEAYTLALRSGDEILIERLGEMRDVLTKPLEVRRAQSASNSTESDRPRAYNAKILHVAHSCITHDTNGYGVRLEQILLALEQAGIDASVMTRLGYPWDLMQHNKVPAQALETSSRGISYRHSKNAAVSLGHSESKYLMAYAEKILSLIHI